jgi:hypothetical protein
MPARGQRAGECGAWFEALADRAAPQRSLEGGPFSRLDICAARTDGASGRCD